MFSGFLGFRSEQMGQIMQDCDLCTHRLLLQHMNTQEDEHLTDAKKMHNTYGGL